MNPPPPPLTRDHCLALLRDMIRIRRFEDHCAEKYTEGHIRGFLHLYVGEEAVAVGVMAALRPVDRVVSTYRDHGHALARGMSSNSVMAEMYGKQEGCCRGRGGSMHLFAADVGFYGGNAIVAGGLPLAVGLALADKMAARPQVTACFFGDGAVDEGEFHESMNLASLWQLPVLFLCENNLYAMGTALARHAAETDLHKKADAYRIPGRRVDGMDVLAVEAAAREAIDAMVTGGGPQFLELRTYRFRAHSMFDPQLYRTKEEVEAWKTKCPIATFIPRMHSWGWLDDAELADIEAEAAEEVRAACSFADAGTPEPLGDLLRHVYGAQP